jgi:formylmethanofuran dehydrogenase subunit C
VRFTGRLERQDVEGGGWVLHTSHGPFTLRGEVPRDYAGAEVEVDGEHDERFGFDMTGPAIQVKGVRRKR